MLKRILEKAARSMKPSPRHPDIMTAGSVDINGEIAKAAYQFFVERGCQHGHDLEDWTRAERLVKSRMRYPK